MEKIVECVPNFSEGRNMETIGKIVSAIEDAGEGSVKVLNIDPGKGANRPGKMMAQRVFSRPSQSLTR